jgi:DHA2 family multidrug resistance protein
MAIIEGQVQRQAAMLAYNDCWMFILISFLVVIPAVFVLRRPRPGAAPVDAH